MTNAKRDKLLVSVATELSEFRKETKQNFKETEDRIKSEFRTEIKNVIQEFSDTNAKDVTECLLIFFGTQSIKNKEFNDKIIDLNEQLQKRN